MKRLKQCNYSKPLSRVLFRKQDINKIHLACKKYPFINYIVYNIINHNLTLTKYKDIEILSAIIMNPTFFRIHGTMMTNKLIIVSKRTNKNFYPSSAALVFFDNRYHFFKLTYVYTGYIVYQWVDDTPKEA
jgi:hypothetical protein